MSLWMPLIAEGAIGALALVAATCITALKDRKGNALKPAADPA